MEFMTGAVVDGGPSIVAMNDKLLDRIAQKVPEMAEAVRLLRAAAAEALLPRDEPNPDAESDGFVQHFVDPDNTDDDTFPGDKPPIYAEPLPGS